MKTSMSTKGQIILPAVLRKQDRIQPGQQFEVERVQSGEYLFRKVEAPGQPGLVDWLLACPVKGWFQRIPSESTAELENRITRVFDE
jgi:AbrB family looped-hinge helix DNA binding protein